MTDSEMTELLLKRDEGVLSEIKAKYGAYLTTIAFNILRSREDSEECLNDVLMSVWKRIPPERPDDLKVFLAVLTRNAALSIWRKQHAAKRGGGHIELLLEELSDAVSSSTSLEGIDRSLSFRKAFNDFLGSLTAEQRRIFLKRYWYMNTVEEIAAGLGITQSKVKVTLHRARSRLKKLLEREGLL